MKIQSNVMYNLIGFVCPAGVLFLSYPPLLHALGAEQFGILMMAMSLAAGLSFLDLGLTAASLRFVAGDLHRGELISASKVINASLLFFGSLGIVISIALCLLAPYIVDWMSIPSNNVTEAIVILQLTAVQVACSLFLGTLGGLFKALDRFDLAAATVSLLSLIMYGLPAFQVAVLNQSLELALATSDIFIFLTCLVGVKYLVDVTVAKGIFLQHCLPDKLTYQRIFSFGVALTVHTLIGQIFTHGQRILVGFLFGPVTLTAYQLSLTIVSKVHAAINAVAEVALPIASTAQNDLIKKTYMRGMAVLFFISAVPLAAIALMSNFILNFWLGASAPELAGSLLPVMCLAYFFVTLSALPYHILNGLGKPGVNVLFAILNVILYALALGELKFLEELNVLNMALAYAFSNIICGIFFQFYCYYFISNLPVCSAIDSSMNDGA